jgi:hypothetical protein
MYVRYIMRVLKSVRHGYLVGPTIFCFCDGAPKGIVSLKMGNYTIYGKIMRP